LKLEEGVVQTTDIPSD